MSCSLAHTVDAHDAHKRDAYAALRRKMVEAQLRKRGVTDIRVLQAMVGVPRHEFVSERFQKIAYGDHPIPIGENQTISQPYIVGLMLQAVALEPQDSVLEIGTGSGYETALLAEMAKQVYSIECHSELSDRAGRILARLGYSNVILAVGDGSQGLPMAAPFNAIVVSAAAPLIPPPLLDQLKDGGRIVIPVGSRPLQELQLVRKRDHDSVVSVIGTCCFVRLMGKHGFTTPATATTGDCPLNIEGQRTMKTTPSEPRGYLHLVCGEYIARHEFSAQELVSLSDTNELVRCPACLLWSLPRQFRPVHLRPR